MSDAWVRGVIGVQMHHVTDLADAARFLTNAQMALRSASTRTGDQRYRMAGESLRALTMRICELEGEARTSMHSLDPEQFIRCRDGEEPWPDEIAAGFIPRHTCQDRCLYHDAGVLEALMQCICARPPCRACAIAGPAPIPPPPDVVNKPHQ